MDLEAGPDQVVAEINNRSLQQVQRCFVDDDFYAILFKGDIARFKALAKVKSILKSRAPTPQNGNAQHHVRAVFADLSSAQALYKGVGQGNTVQFCAHTLLYDP